MFVCVCEREVTCVCEGDVVNQKGNYEVLVCVCLGVREPVSVEGICFYLNLK